MKKITIIFFILFLYKIDTLKAQNDEKPKELVKKGWTFGALPVVAFDSDIGLIYGGLVNFYDFGDGSQYPDYRHSIYLELSNSTKGSGVAQVKYDSKYLIPNVRISAGLGYFTEQMLDFYGFNGYESFYNSNYTDKNSNEYKSRAYYRQDQKMIRGTIDFTGNFPKSNLKWVAGLGYFQMKAGSVDVDKLNKGQSAKDTLPHVENVPGNYEKYVEWWFIRPDEKKGGNVGVLKTGLVYDSRDNEPNPMKGIWSEVLIMGTRQFKSSNYTYFQLALTHRHYFTIIPKILNLACRVSFQQKIIGDMPYFMMPFLFTSNKPPINGLGGNYTLRGIMRNRAVGEGMAYANFELRWKFIKSVIKNNNFYAALSAFTDIGMVTKKHLFYMYKIESTEYLALGTKEKLHQSVGAGIHFALNDNFIVAVDYGIPFNKQDGKSGLYINLDFLY